MTVRSLAVPVLATGLALATSASAQEPEQGSPDQSEPTATAPQVGQAVDALPQQNPFYLGLDYRGIATDPEFPDRDWYEREGIDSPHDVDPRKQFRLPRPEPGLVIELR